MPKFVLYYIIIWVSWGLKTIGALCPHLTPCAVIRSGGIASEVCISSATQSTCQLRPTCTGTAAFCHATCVTC